MSDEEEVLKRRLNTPLPPRKATKPKAKGLPGKPTYSGRRMSRPSSRGRKGSR